MIATRLLLAGEMTGHVATLATAMITQSDNDAAWALYPQVGKDGLEPWIAAHYGITGLGGPPSMPGIWGSTQITAAGMVRFYAAVKNDPKVWPWLSNAMHHYQASSSAGEPNAFGLAAADPSAAVKNGWDTNRDPVHPTNAIVNSTGYVVGDRYAVAILSEGPGSLYYTGGEAIVTHEAELLFSGSPAGPSGNSSAPLVVLDPGHNGGNSTHTAEIDRLVPSGYGVEKPCNTTGTNTNAGYPEHAFTWDVAQRVKAILQAHGVRVLLTRHNDTGVGPCVNVRAKIESTPGAAAAIAIHADGAPSSGHGFHVCLASRRPVGASAATMAKSVQLGTAIHNDLASSSGLVPSTYVGTNGYFYRDDLAGLNLSTNPTAFLELGNMRNAHDAALQSSAAGRARLSAAVAAGILAFLGR
jgi:N-acetylmuramoyl-L-alanine amidase